MGQCACRPRSRPLGRRQRAPSDGRRRHRSASDARRHAAAGARKQQTKQSVRSAPALSPKGGGTRGSASAARVSSPGSRPGAKIDGPPAHKRGRPKRFTQGLGAAAVQTRHYMTCRRPSGDIEYYKLFRSSMESMKVEPRIIVSLFYSGAPIPSLRVQGSQSGSLVNHPAFPSSLFRHIYSLYQRIMHVHGNNSHFP